MEMRPEDIDRMQDTIGSIRDDAERALKTMAVHEAVCAERYRAIEDALKKLWIVFLGLLLLEIGRASLPDLIKMLAGLVR